MSCRWVAFALLGAALLGAPSARADAWDARLSSRLTLGGGAYVPEQRVEPWPLVELGLRTDLLLGEARPARVRLGPALDLRTEGFRTFEVAGGLAVLLPLDQGFALTLTGAAGWGARPEERDGPLALGALAFGWRPYDYFGPYAWAVQLYTAARVQALDPRVWELTVGVEVDLEIVFVIPILFVVQLARGGDPA